MTHILIFLLVGTMTTVSSSLEVIWARGIINNNALKAAISSGTISLIYAVSLYLAFIDKYPIALVGMVLGNFIGTYFAVKMKKSK